jgi:glutaredoxin
MLEIILYARPGCHLCAQARTTIDALLAERRRRGLEAPDVVERDISTDAAELVEEFIERNRREITAPAPAEV